MNRRIYRDGEVPHGVKVLGVRVQIPRVLFATSEGVQDDLALHETTMVYAEITEEEWARACNDQAAINALGQQIGPEIAAALGGYVKGWH